MLEPLPLELSNLPVAWTSPPHPVPRPDVHNNRNSVEPLELPSETGPLSLSLLGSRSSSGSPDPLACDDLDATMYSHRFPTGYRLNKRFARSYTLREEIGSGGYGFVMVASRRGCSGDVAVKFIIRKKVPTHAWVQDSKLGPLPTEIWLLSRIRHPNIADFLEYFEDDVYYYLVRSMIRNTLVLLNCYGKVQELHGSPWVAKCALRVGGHSTSRNYSMPGLSSSFSTTSTADSVLLTPMSSQSPTTEVFEAQLFTPTPDECPFTHTKGLKTKKSASRRRASHDLFECIEQSPGKRLPEHQAKLVFRQVVEAVWYLNRKGIIHCDIKDENILVDSQLRVNLSQFLSSL